jgi:gas vesicle protein
MVTDKEAMCKALKETEDRVMSKIKERAEQMKKDPKIMKEIEDSFDFSPAS